MSGFQPYITRNGRPIYPNRLTTYTVNKAFNSFLSNENFLYDTYERRGITVNGLERGDLVTNYNMNPEIVVLL